MSSYFPTQEQFAAIFPSCKDKGGWYAALSSILPACGITTKNQVMCLAQCGHESQEFNTMRENFNYSAEGLLKIFPKYFNKDTVAAYARNPQKIANRVYANRMGNGDEASGDGFKYRGCGLIQLTGKDNLSRLSQQVFGDDRVVQNPEVILDKENAVKSACWFWNSANLNKYTDPIDMLTITKKINGGVIGLESRNALLAKIHEILK